MSKKIGVLITLDGEKEFTQGLKNAQTSAKALKGDLSGLASEYKGNANSLEYLTKRQEKLRDAQQAYERVLAQAKSGQAHALSGLNQQKDALEQLRKQLEKAKAAQKQMEDSGDTSSKAYKKQCQAVEDLEKAVQEQNTEYLRAEGRMTSWDLKVSQAERSLRENSAAIKQNEAYMKEAEQATDHCATSIDRFGKEADDAKDSVKEMGIGLGTMIKAKAVDLAGDALRELGRKAIEAGKYVIEVGSDFEKAMSEVEAISGAAGSSLDALSKKAQQLGASTKFSATEVAQGFKYMSLAGWSTQQMLSGIDGIVNLAAASEMDLAEASDMVTDYLSAFGLAASDAGRMADQMAYAQANSNTTVQLLGESFANCAANMHAAGQDMETTTSFLEAMANQGRKGSQAGTTLSAIMRDLTAKMKDGKIQIGDTSIAVMDAEGNFRDLTDIMTDVEAATKGMGTAQRTSALSATFTARSIAGVNMILTEGMDKISGYEDHLRSCDGTAESMASTMQDNLQGAVTELSSATEGLGIALYNKVSGPLTSAVETVTGLIGGITDAITTEKSELETFIDDIETANEDVQGLLDSAKEHEESGMGQVANMEAYKDVLLELNGLEELNEFQKYQMKSAVEALSGVMPELAAHFDEETSSLNLTNQELEKMFDNAEALAMQSALIAAQKDSYDALAQATINKAKADAAVRAAEEQLTEANRRNQESVDYLSGGYGDCYREVMIAEGVLKDATDAQKMANDQMDQAQKEIDDTQEALQPLYDEYGILTDKTGEATTSQGELGEAALDAADDVDDSAERMEEAAKKVADAHKEASEAIVEAYNSAKQQAEGSFDIDPLGDGFGGGIDKTVEEMNEAMQSELSGMENYAKNLEIVKDHVGKEIAPEFLQYLLNLGADGANTLQHIANTFEEDDGAEKVRALSDSYVRSLDMREEISEGLAADSLALQAGLGQLGSSAREWEGLDEVVASITEETGAVTDSTMQLFNEAKETAKACGVKIPEGLAEGIASSTDPEEAMISATEQLNAAVQGQAEGLLEIAKSKGIEIPESISEGIEQGGQAAVDAYNEVLALISGADSEVAAAASEAGSTLTSETASSISSNSGVVDSAASDMASGAATAAGGASSEFSDAGSEAGGKYAEGLKSQQAAAKGAGTSISLGASAGVRARENVFSTSGTTSGSNYAQGIVSQAGSASSAGAALAAGAMSAVRGGSAGSFDIGYSISAGVASGIASGASMAISAAASMASSALSAAKAALDIHSPSKKFQNDVGRQIGKGLMFGIRQSMPATVAAAQKLASATLSPATSWLRLYKKRNKVTLSDEAYFWEVMTNFSKKGTAAYEKSMAKWTRYSIAARFGVSKTKTTSSGKTEVKDTETYYNEIYRAAKTFFDRLSVRQDISVKHEIAYWYQVRKQLKYGTQAYLEATQKIKELRDSIGTTETASNLLETYQTYYSLSEKAEMQYWNTVRYRYKAGTEERVKADQKYLEAKKKYTEKLKDIEDDYADKIKKVRDTLKENIADVQKTYQDAYESRREQIAGAFDLFDAFESERESGEALLFNIKAQAAGYKDWREQLGSLEGRGILSKELLEAIKEKGPENSAAVHALSTLSDEQLKEYDAAYREKMEQASAQARADTKELKVSTVEEIRSLKDKAASEIESLKAQRKEETLQVKEGISDGLTTLAYNVRTIASDQTAKLINVLQSVAPEGKTVKASKVSAALVREINSGASDATFKASDRIKTIINSGKERSKTLSAKEKTHSPLWQYIVSRYGRVPTNSMYRLLGNALGVAVSDTVTNAQRTKILEALKKKGYRSGTRYLNDDYAWMDEEGLGSELIIRKKDRAVLNASVQKGDAIVPANLTENLFSWGAFSPERVFAAMEKQQAAVLATANAVSLQALNERTIRGERLEIKAAGDDDMKEMMTTLTAAVKEFLPYLAERQQVVLDSGKLVSGISDEMSNELAMRRRRRR